MGDVKEKWTDGSEKKLTYWKPFKYNVRKGLNVEMYWDDKEDKEVLQFDFKTSYKNLPYLSPDFDLD